MKILKQVYEVETNVFACKYGMSIRQWFYVEDGLSTCACMPRLGAWWS